ncbi:MAG: DnaD domain protein [Eubacterium sp.]
MSFSLTTQFSQQYTYIPNAFIDTYMPDANGSFVKVYLYLLRQMNTATPVLTIEMMADMLSNTEADILRALRYWKKQGLLEIEEMDGEITHLCLLPFDTSSTPEVAASYERVPESLSTPQPIASQISPEIPQEAVTQHTTSSQPMITRELPPRQNYTPLMAEALKKDLEINSCLSSVEALLGTTMSDSHMQLILYLMSDVGFSRELIITLYETALARDKRSSRYIEAIALDWAKKGIRTPEEAMEETNQFHGTYKVVATALGIKRPLAPAERAIIDHFAEYHFSEDILAEACNRTVLQSGDTNLNYTASILSDWHKKGVKTLDDIKECDKSYHRMKQATGKKKETGNKNQFQNFPQREYTQSDYANLEKQLLQP